MNIDDPCDDDRTDAGMGPDFVDPDELDKLDAQLSSFTPQKLQTFHGSFGRADADKFDMPPLTEPPSATDVEQAFMVPAQVFDLDLPWACDGGRVLNKFGVRIGSFESWDAAEAIVAMMNGSAQLLEVANSLQQAVPDAPAPASEQPADESALREKISAFLADTAGRRPGTNVKFS